MGKPYIIKHDSDTAEELLRSHPYDLQLLQRVLIEHFLLREGTHESLARLCRSITMRVSWHRIVARSVHVECAWKPKTNEIRVFAPGKLKSVMCEISPRTWWRFWERRFEVVYHLDVLYGRAWEVELDAEMGVVKERLLSIS